MCGKDRNKLFGCSTLCQCFIMFLTLAIQHSYKFAATEGMEQHSPTPLFLGFHLNDLYTSQDPYK